jgi:hypothetical protein
MANLNLEAITKNIFKLLDYSGTTDVNFANLLAISEKQFRLIKNGQAEYNIKSINKACEFFNVSLSKINGKEIEINNDYREQLANRHKDNSEYYTLLESRPPIRHAIKFALLADLEFKNNGLIVGEIREIFIRKGWIFTSRYISTSLIRNSDLVDIVGKRLVKGKNANVYGPKMSL